MTTKYRMKRLAYECGGGRVTNEEAAAVAGLVEKLGQPTYADCPGDATEIVWTSVSSLDVNKVRRAYRSCKGPSGFRSKRRVARLTRCLDRHQSLRWYQRLRCNQGG